MGAVAAIRILHRRKLLEVAPDIRPQVEAELAAEHERIAGGVDKAVEIGVVDEVVEPGRHPHRPGPRDRRRRPGAARGARQHPAVAPAPRSPCNAGLWTHHTRAAPCNAGLWTHHTRAGRTSRPAAATSSTTSASTTTTTPYPVAVCWSPSRGTSSPAAIAGRLNAR